ncbi:SDR family NAD(P)-dependent oxidoreductase [Arcicella lustrica]|uniref:SDR family oxidoreductase n=1 Tax=Arcicella lustrica TaxID=2984196 RepID=A0ABU5SLQ3_9BACT|nr:SDR family oxidoreductase [Arcicella sp. DC25W]MEA5428216.1 SDR family oxidoreductase [Arcicella sp. DC25W]
MYALITGASKGIGKEIAIELAKQKYNLLLVARSEGLLREVAIELQEKYGVKVDYLAVDLATVDVARQVFDWVAKNQYEVSVLVNNAGYGSVGNFDTYSIEQNRDMMNLNMATLTEMCHVFLPMLKRQSKAYIMNIASSTAYQALPKMAVYAATKIYVLNFSRALKHELKDTSVSVTCISPGATDTGFNDRAAVPAKARKAAEKVAMTPEVVAKISVKAMFDKKTEVIPGIVNKLGAFLAWLAPKSITENVAAGIYQ